MDQNHNGNWGSAPLHPFEAAQQQQGGKRHYSEQQPTADGLGTVHFHQAFKRLRVQEDDDTSMGQTPPRWNNHQHPPSYYREQRPSHHYQQSAGQDSMSDDCRTPPAKMPAEYQGVPDTDYKSVNHVLGQLHRQRRLREQQESSSMNLNQRFAQQSMAVHHHYHHGGGDSRPLTPSKRSADGMQTDYYPQVTTTASYSTPPVNRRRKVVHLHTDSKLG